MGKKIRKMVFNSLHNEGTIVIPTKEAIKENVNFKRGEIVGFYGARPLCGYIIRSCDNSTKKNEYDEIYAGWCKKDKNQEGI